MMRSNKIRLWGSIFLVLLLGQSLEAVPSFAGMLKAVSETAPKETRVAQDLNLLLQQFLLSKDEKQSETFLDEILAQKTASISTLEALIQTGRLYPPEAYTGSLHNDIEVAGYKMSYALYVPKNYSPEKKYPLIVCLHGAGFVGDSYIDRWVSRLNDEWILLCPTIGMGAWWSPEGEALILNALEEVTTRYNVDAKRTILTGMSNGGIGVYLVGMFHADLFAAVSPMAAGIPNEVFDFLENFSSTGIYIIHGAHDQVMPVRLSQEISQYLDKVKIPYTYREHGKEHERAGGHFFPREELPALISWFKKQERITDPARVVLVGDKVHLKPLYWAQIDQAFGPIADVQRSLFTNEDLELVKEGAYAKLIAEIEGNRVTVSSERIQSFTLFFNRRLIDYKKPVVVVANGKTVFEGLLKESRAFLLTEAQRRGDTLSLYSASVTIDLKEKIKSEK